MQKKVFKYILYFAVIFLVIITMPGVHDSAFFKMMAGVVVVNVLFASWLLKFNIFLRIASGLVLPVLAAYTAYSVNIFFFSHIEGLILPSLVFFVLFVIISIPLWQLVIRFAATALKRNNRRYQ